MSTLKIGDKVRPCWNGAHCRKTKRVIFNAKVDPCRWMVTAILPDGRINVALRESWFSNIRSWVRVSA